MSFKKLSFLTVPLVTIFFLLTSCFAEGVNGAQSAKDQFQRDDSGLDQPQTPTDTYSYIPVVITNEPVVSGGAIVVDHRHTDISAIPDYWIEQAKQYVVHYAHTSHGGQILQGLNWLEGRDPKYNVDIAESGPVTIPTDATALGLYDGNNYPGTTYIHPEMYWFSDDGRNHTRSVMDTGWFDLSTWTWCGQMSAYTVPQVQSYLDALDQFMIEYPGARFIYFTGHTDGSQPGGTLWRNNDMVRQHVQQNGGILFDFADIESYDPDGTFYPTATDTCGWCNAWCTAHPSNFECQSRPGCNHSNGLQCTLKGQAFWWMMARLAGWDGTPAP